jgi:hypothetical protein
MTSDHHHLDQISNLVQQCRPKLASELRPKTLFVAWNGIPCLVFEGFPPPCVETKGQLNNNNTDLLKPENFGSKWPKVTLGYPSNPIETVQELETIKSICQSFQNNDNNDWKASSGGAVVSVEKLSIVHYEQRSLEVIIQRRDYTVGGDESKKNESSLVTSSSSSSSSPETTKCSSSDSSHERASQDEMDRVNGVLAEWDDTSTYLENVRPPPAQPYREGSPSGYCCVVFLELKENDPILKVIQEFRGKIDEAFPGRFEWMKDDSLHCTLRAMDPKTTAS